MVHDITVSNSYNGVGSTTEKIKVVIKCYREVGPNHKAVLAKLQLLSSDDFGTVKVQDMKNYYRRVLSKDDPLKQAIVAAGANKSESALWEEYNLLPDPVERVEIDEDTERR